MYKGPPVQINLPETVPVPEAGMALNFVCLNFQRNFHSDANFVQARV